MLIIILAIYTLNIGFKTQIPKVITPHQILCYYVSGHIAISVTVKVSYITYFDVWAFFCVLPIFFVIWEWTVLLTQKHHFKQLIVEGDRVDGEHGEGRDEEEDPEHQLLPRPHRLRHLHHRLLDLCPRQH